MNDAPAVIQATFADWRTVKGRKQLQLIFEVPLERQVEILSILGAPNAADAKWCAIALLNLKGGGASEHSNSKHETTPPPSQSTAGAQQDPPLSLLRERRSWAELTPTTQACIRCTEPIFQQWVIKQGFNEEEDKEENAARYVRRECDVNSRGALSTNKVKAALWRSLENRFLADEQMERALG